MAKDCGTKENPDRCAVIKHLNNIIIQAKLTCDHCIANSIKVTKKSKKILDIDPAMIKRSLIVLIVCQKVKRDLRSHQLRVIFN